MVGVVVVGCVTGMELGVVVVSAELEFEAEKLDDADVDVVVELLNAAEWLANSRAKSTL